MKLCYLASPFEIVSSGAKGRITHQSTVLTTHKGNGHSFNDGLASLLQESEENMAKAETKLHKLKSEFSLKSDRFAIANIW